jgi:septum formation topological specificity factor MinE
MDIIISQTNYTPEEASKLLEKYNGDHIAVIKDYLGIKPKKVVIKSVNQEIYKMLRQQIDISEYNKNANLNANPNAI